MVAIPETATIPKAITNAFGASTSSEIYAEQIGLEKDRLRLEWISASEGKRLQEVVNEMTETLRQLGPSKIKEIVETIRKITDLSYMADAKPKLKLAIYWGAACGGCCVSVLDVHEHLFDITEHADLVFWPIALDTKYEDVEAMPDHSIDITLFNGAIRNSENEHMAHLLRQKSKIMIGYGSCAHMGGIPGLANFSNKEDIFRSAFTKRANPPLTRIR